MDNLEKKWSLKKDLKYWLYWKWWALSVGIIGVLQKQHLKVDPDEPISWRDYISFCHAVADMKVGRYWAEVEPGIVEAYFLPAIGTPQIFVDIDIKRLSKIVKKKKPIEIRINLPTSDTMSKEEIEEFSQWLRDQVTQVMALRNIHARRYNKWVRVGAMSEFLIVALLMARSWMYMGRSIPILGLIEVGGDAIFWGMFIYWTATTFRAFNHLLAEAPPSAAKIVEEIECAKIIPQYNEKVSEAWLNWLTRCDDREVELYKRMLKIYGSKRRICRHEDPIAQFYRALIKEREQKNSPLFHFYPASWRGRRKREIIGAPTSEGKYIFKIWRPGL